jgi:hypothetical protein
MWIVCGLSIGGSIVVGNGAGFPVGALGRGMGVFHKIGLVNPGHISLHSSLYTGGRRSVVVSLVSVL